MSNYEHFITPKNLKAAWHLTRADTKKDILDTSISVQSFASNLNSEILEISRSLTTNDFRPSPRIYVELPKNNFGTRPGSVLSIKDRIVLWSAIRILAPIIDQEIPSGVYSYRLKKTPTKTSLFEESDSINLPFISQRDITQEIDDFDEWYIRWEEFDEASKASIDNGYNFLSVTDVSAYFENINITILRDILLQICPDDQRIINTIIQCLSSWTPVTQKGYRPSRGIPQSNSVSSFFGNIYLLDLDKFFSEFGKKIDLQYYRYMDDVRIFTKSEADARRVVLEMETQLRKLHLNVQSAKTLVLAEDKGEITEHLYDPRFERIKAISQLLQKDINDHKVKILLSEIVTLLRAKYAGRPSILRNRKGLTTLESRTLRFASRILNNHGISLHIEAIFNGIKNSPDPRIMRSFVGAVRSHPRKSSFNNMIRDFTQSDFNLFGYQEGEVIRGLKFVGRIDSAWKGYAISKIEKSENSDHLRFQCVSLLNRFLLKKNEIQQIIAILQKEKNPYIICALLVFLGQAKKYDQYNFPFKLLKSSPNNEIKSTILSLEDHKSNEETASRMLNHCFSDESGATLINKMGYMWHLSHTKNLKVLAAMHKPLKYFIKKHPAIGFRSTLNVYLKRINDREIYLNN